MRKLVLVSAAAAALGGCTQSSQAPIISSLDPGQLQSIQTRVFATADHAFALRQVISTLQDLGYSIDKVQAASGLVGATKAANLNLTAIVQPGAGATTVVHADAYVTIGTNAYEVDDPTFYNADFFTPLSRSLPPSAAQALPPAAAPQPYAPETYPASPVVTQPDVAQPAGAAPSNDTSWHESPSP
jgi:hypothetical protein